MAKSLTYQDRLDRFFSRCLPEPNSGCWIWTGEIRHDGYGECWVFGRRERAHQASFRELKGEALPDGLMIRHKCDNRACCNPGHLLSGTQADNVRDKVDRNRQCRGETHGVAKLTERDVLEIRASEMSGRELSKIYGLSQVQIDKIKRRKAWGHIDGPPSVYPNMEERVRRGEDHSMVKLTEDDVIAIRRSHDLQADLAAVYGVDQTTISSIRLRKTWKHIS